MAAPPLDALPPRPLAARPDAPGAVLVACTLNAVRSPMAEALLKHLFGRQFYVDSAGVSAEPVDPFALAVMREIGLDLARHTAKTFDTLGDGSFDLILALSHSAEARARDFARLRAVEIERWEIPDPTGAGGSREQRLAAYREVRDALCRQLIARFAIQPPRRAASVSEPGAGAGAGLDNPPEER